MNRNNFKFYVALITILIYEVVMIIFHLDGFTLSKLVITLLIWYSFFLTFIYFLKQYKFLKISVPRFAFYILLLLLLWNGISILRSIIHIEDQISTIFGSVFHVLALLVPFLIVYSAKKDNLRILHKYFVKLLKIGVILFVTFFVINGFNLNEIQSRLLFQFFLPVVFLITVLPFEQKKNKFLVLVCLPLLFFAAYKLSIRTMMIREVMLLGCLLAVYLYAKFNLKWILRLSIIALMIPLLLFQQSAETGESAFQKFGLESSDADLKTDTRTFLYKEVFEDLISNNELIIGKGANGRYFSKFFSDDLGIEANRESVEVGLLAILLKGGLIAVTLMLILLISSIYYAFFKSKNYYVVGIGFTLLVYTVLLFIENILNYSSYNIWVWFFIGICLSKQTRAMTNREIRLLLHDKINLR